MKSSVYKSYDELPLFLNSDLVAKDFTFDSERYYPESYAHLDLNDEGPQWKIFSAEELRRRDQQGHQSLKEKYGK